MQSEARAEIQVVGEPIRTFAEVAGKWNNPYGHNIDLTLERTGYFSALIAGENPKHGVGTIDVAGNLILQAGGRITLRRKDAGTLCGKVEYRLIIAMERYICFYKK